MPSLETLKCQSLPPAIDIARLTNLKELRLNYVTSRIEKYGDALAKNLINLERLNIKYHPNHHILPFIRYSKKLETFHFLTNHVVGLDLFTLNEERKILIASRFIWSKRTTWLQNGSRKLRHLVILNSVANLMNFASQLLLINKMK